MPMQADTREMRTRARECEVRERLGDGKGWISVLPLRTEAWPRQYSLCA